MRQMPWDAEIQNLLLDGGWISSSVVQDVQD